LILDEPTNHLDLHAAIWLEHYLTTYPYTILLVSHDESFLDTVVDNIIHFNNQRLTRYKGNWTSYIKQREQKKKETDKKHKAQEKQENKLKQSVQKNKGSKTGKIAKNNLEKAKKERVEVIRDEKEVCFEFPDPGVVTETALLQFKNVKFGYSWEKILFTDLDFGIYHDSRIGLVGANGVGKSTIMNLMLSDLTPLDGQVICNPHLRIARFSQHHVDQLDMEKTPVEHLQALGGEQNTAELRKHLGRFGIVGNVALQKIESLSGGQKSRVAFAACAAKHPHIMLLDEPSNHLDLYAIKALAKGLQEYGGGLVVISHNQRLIEDCCNQLWVVYADGTAKKFEGSFQEYKEVVIAELEENDQLYTQK
jgi:ATPase subunit of ABC transporter with duplicated ATPase domains